MPDLSCDQEHAVLRAVASGEWGSQLQAHAESCANCSEVVRVSQLLQQLVAAPKPELPSAGYVWWQSRLRERRTAQRRVSRVFAITKTATVSVSMIGMAGWIIRHWSEFSEGTKAGLKSVSGWSSSSVGSDSVVLVCLSFALLGLNLLLTIRAIATKHQE